MRELTFDEIQAVEGEGVGSAFLSGAGAGAFVGALGGGPMGSAVGALVGGGLGVAFYLM